MSVTCQKSDNLHGTGSISNYINRNAFDKLYIVW